MVQSIKTTEFFEIFNGIWNLTNPSLSNSSFFEATYELLNKLSFVQSFKDEIPVIFNADGLTSTKLPSLS